MHIALDRARTLVGLQSVFVALQNTIEHGHQKARHLQHGHRNGDIAYHGGHHQGQVRYCADARLDDQRWNDLRSLGEDALVQQGTQPVGCIGRVAQARCCFQQPEAHHGTQHIGQHHQGGKARRSLHPGVEVVDGIPSHRQESFPARLTRPVIKTGAAGAVPVRTSHVSAGYFCTQSQNRVAGCGTSGTRGYGDAPTIFAQLLAH
ncbi:hypothetical protein D3C72_1419510 [compost metagenome]